MRNQANPLHRHAFNDMRGKLNLMFPKAFPGEGGQRRPLAIGVREEMLKELKGLYSPATIKSFLAVWCSRPRYLLATAAAAGRINLDGEVVEAVAPTHREFARQALIRRGKFTKHPAVRGDALAVAA